jgi:hypothetical protein
MTLLETLAARSAIRVLTGHLDGIDDEGRVLFRADGSDASVPVVIGIEISDGAMVKAARLSRRAFVLAAEDTLILAGLLRERVAGTSRDALPGELEVRLEGETLRLSAEREIELRCGRSRITLHRDGRVSISGSHLLHSSTGPIRVKGATIALN